jgi:hypothetical protein
MGGINPEREARRRGKPTDRLRLFTHDFLLTAHCEAPGCEHSRELSVSLLLKAFGSECTLAQAGARLRCSRCGARGARMTVRFTGRHGDGR